MQTLEPIVAKLPLFAGMKEEHLALIAGCTTNVRFEEGEVIGRAGETADRFWIIREGQVALELDAPGRGSVVVLTVGPDDVLGWSWLLPPHQLHFDMRALVPTRALMFQGHCLRGKFSSDHELGYEMLRRFMGVIVERLEATSLQLLDVYGDHD
jgi:CRP/FNR family cyclic AMP-dependent transcriptional regulator